MAKNRKFLGSGLTYPLQTSASGDFKIDINDTDTVKSALTFLLHTRKGERPHRPELGTRLPDFKHEPNSPEIRDALATEIRETLVNEPRLTSLRVLVDSNPADETQVLIRISYRVIPENVPQNLVFPFYLGV